MKTSLAALSCLLALALCSCGSVIQEWEDNPALVRSKAELAGSATVFTYLSVKPEAKAGAAHLREVVKAVRSVVVTFPEQGFSMFLPAVNAKLEQVLTGDAAVYLPAAKLLASVLLDSLQQKADKDNWFDDKEAVSDILSAFLSGADSALAAYVTPDT